MITFFFWKLQAMEELRKFMVVKELPSKNRQKLMRNLRVRRIEYISIIHIRNGQEQRLAVLQNVKLPHN